MTGFHVLCHDFKLPTNLPLHSPQNQQRGHCRWWSPHPERTKTSCSCCALSRNTDKRSDSRQSAHAAQTGPACRKKQITKKILGCFPLIYKCKQKDFTGSVILFVFTCVLLCNSLTIQLLSTESGVTIRVALADKPSVGSGMADSTPTDSKKAQKHLPNCS